MYVSAKADSVCEKDIPFMDVTLLHHSAFSSISTKIFQLYTRMFGNGKRIQVYNRPVYPIPSTPHLSFNLTYLTSFQSWTQYSLSFRFHNPNGSIFSITKTSSMLTLRARLVKKKKHMVYFYQMFGLLFSISIKISI